MTKPKLILAIEAAIRGGSVSLLEGEREIVSSQGVTDVSRAEDLIINILGLFKTSGVDKKSVDIIAVSNGPGSFTGIRIGLATTLGLTNSLNIPCFGVSLLAAVANANTRENGIAVVLPIGRKDICWQTFKFELGFAIPSAPPRSESLNVFLTSVDQTSGQDFLVQQDLFDSLESDGTLPARAFPIESNLAYIVGLAALNRQFTSDLNPLYVQNSRVLGGIS